MSNHAAMFTAAPKPSIQAQSLADRTENTPGSRGGRMAQGAVPDAPTSLRLVFLLAE